MHFHACLPSPKESRPTILFQGAHDTITTTMHYYKGSPLKLPYIHLTLFDPPPKKNMGPLKNQPMFRALKKRKKKREIVLVQPRYRALSQHVARAQAAMAAFIETKSRGSWARWANWACKNFDKKQREFSAKRTFR